MRSYLFPSGRRIALASGVALFYLAACAQSANAAGFFESLFGIRPQPAVAPAATPARGVNPRGSSRKPKKPRVAAAALDAGNGARRSAPALRPQALGGPQGQFLLDPTLRRGDVVVTSEGLKVFMGAGARGQHGNGDFVALSKAGRQVSGNSSELRAIERANSCAVLSRVVQQAVQPTAASAKANVEAPVVASDPGPASARSTTARRTASAAE